MLFFLDGGGSMVGIVLAVASAVTYGCYLTSMDKSSLRSMNPNKVACYMGLFNACAMLLMDIPMQKINFFLPPLAMLYTFIVAIGTSFLAVALLQLGIRDLGASTAAVFCMFEPVSSVLSGWLFLHEAMTWQKALGCVIILGGVTMMVLSDLRNQRRTEALGEPQRYVRKEVEAGAPQAAVQVSTEMAAPVETAAGDRPEKRPGRPPQRNLVENSVETGENPGKSQWHVLFPDQKPRKQARWNPADLTNSTKCAVFCSVGRNSML